MRIPHPALLAACLALSACGGGGGAGPPPCVAGATCTPSSACSLGEVRCEASGPTCVATAPRPDGTACGEGATCSGGACLRTVTVTAVDRYLDDTGNVVAVPIEAFPGVMGTALPEPGGHSTMPPRKNGGNMDIKQLTAGTTLSLPVWVEGALFSVGDGHAAQGDGEVCVTAVEMAAEVTLRFGLLSGRGIPEPRFRTRGPIGVGTSRGPWVATTAHGPDLFASAQQAVRYIIDHMVEERGLSREEAYIVASVAVDLKISEIVDAPNWIVSAFLPENIFE